MRLKVFVGYCGLAFVATGVLTYGVIQWLYRSLDRAVLKAREEA